MDIKMASIEDRFNAAVNVIKNLPKNGSYQPSSAMMLTFYSYFKQATQGPCRQKKPPFWDVVGRAKWDAWHALGEMSRERAMGLYVDELKKIIETMSFTENVANFMGSIDELDNVNFDDLEAVAPEIIKMARSHPNSPFASRGNSPLHGTSAQNIYTNGETDNSDAYLNQNGHSSTVEQSDDEYIDTVEDNVEFTSYKKPRAHLNNPSTRSESSSEITRDHLNSSISPAVLQQILATMQRMNSDLAVIHQRINVMEKHVSELKSTQKRIHRKYPHWWPFNDISPAWFVFLILWPFLTQRLGRMLQRKK